MINIISKNGKRIGKISDDSSQDDIIYIDGKPVTLSDVYDDPALFQKFNDEIQKTNNAIRLEDESI